MLFNQERTHEKGASRRQEFSKGGGEVALFHSCLLGIALSSYGIHLTDLKNLDHFADELLLTFIIIMNFYELL